MGRKGKPRPRFRIGDALVLDGVNDYADVADAPALRPTRDFTVEAWVFADPPHVGNGNGIVLAKSSGGGEFNVFHQVGSGDCSFFPSLGASLFVRAGSPSGYVCGSPPVPQSWRQVVLRRRFADSTADLWLDGVLVTSKTDPIAAIDMNATGPFCIGEYCGGGNTFRGLINEVRYSMIARPPDELANRAPSRVVLGPRVSAP